MRTLEGKADWHLKELRASLEKRGWRVAAELPGDDRTISGSWDRVTLAML